MASLTTSDVDSYVQLHFCHPGKGHKKQALFLTSCDHDHEKLYQKQLTNWIFFCNADQCAAWHPCAKRILTKEKSFLTGNSIPSPTITFGGNCLQQQQQLLRRAQAESIVKIGLFEDDVGSNARRFCRRGMPCTVCALQLPSKVPEDYF